MQFEIQCPGCCPKFIGAVPHSSQCSRYEKTTAVHLPNGSDCSHLVGDPGKPHNYGVRGAPWTKLLTDYDRILLGFGMHIQWQL